LYEGTPYTKDVIVRGMATYDPKAEAIATGAHDIPCDESAVALVASVSGRASGTIVVVEGCGRRHTYACGRVCMLTSRLSTAPEARR
jgi:hypothetical protein